MEKINNYLQLLYLSEDLNYIQEGVGDMIKQFTADKAKNILKRLSNLADERNIKGIQSFGKTTGFSKIKLPTIDNYMSSKYDEYNKIKDFAHKVLKNSLRGRHNKKLLDITSSYLAVRSFMPERRGAVAKPKRDSRDRIKDFVSKYNSYYDEYEEKAKDSEPKIQIPKESIPDYVLGITVIISIVSILGFGVWFIYTHVHMIFFLIAFMVLTSFILAVGKAATAAAGIK
jgi:hypothetical protein